MNNVQCLSHTKWDCKFHVVWIPKCRRKMLYGQLRKNLGEVFHELARQKESKVLEGHLQSDHVHMLISIPPKYSVSQVVGYMKGKSAIHIARTYLGQRKNYSGMIFGHGAILFQQLVPMKRLCGAYIREQEQEDHRVEQLSLFQIVDHRMVVRKSVEHTALSGSQSFKPPALPVVTDFSSAGNLIVVKRKWNRSTPPYNQRRTLYEMPGMYYC